MRIDIYSDTVCPWCFLGKRRLEIALALRPSLQPEIVWRPYELNPDLPSEGMERTKYLTAKFGDSGRIIENEQALVRQGEAIGLKFRFDLIGRMPNSRGSHLLIAHAARRGAAAPIMDRVMRAYFEEGVDIGETEELARLGADCGLSEREVSAALVLREGQDGVVAAERHAASLGLSGIPTFVFDGQYAMAGAQEPAALARAFDHVSELAAERGSGH